MTDEPNITVRRIDYWTPDGRVVCPTGEAINRLLEATWPTWSPTQEAPVAFRRADT